MDELICRCMSVPAIVSVYRRLFVNMYVSIHVERVRESVSS